jgi:serine/threonine-protein kinase
VTDASPTAEALPARIGKYEIASLLGRGAMGVVYQAYDPMLDREVALKVMLPQIAGDPDQKARFEREARAVAKIVHPNVLTVFDLGYHHDGSPYIAMELLKGQDLLHRMVQDPALALDEKIDIVVQILDGLGHAHQVGIVHRDIKPANVFLTQDGTVKIMDFGVARFTRTSITEAGAVLGTADYMAPEYVQGGDVDARSDLWSAGCVLHELFTGVRPFAGESLMTVFYRITHEDPRPELPSGPEYAGLRAVVRRALDRDPAARYQSAAEFAADLRGLLDAEPRSTDELFDALADEAARPAAAAAAPVSRPLAPPPPVPAPARAADPTPLFRLIREIHVGAKSGHLHFTNGNERRSLFFLRGNVLHATSDVEGDHLGNTLVRYGFITQLDLERATPIVLSHRRRLGDVLLELDTLERARLDEGIGLHVRDVLFGVLDRDDGSFGFEEMWADADREDGSSPVPPGQIILEAARRIQTPDVIRKVLGDLDRALVLSANPLLRAQRLTLSPTDGFLLSRVDGTLTTREVFQLIPLPAEDTEHSLFALLCTGVVDHLPRTATSRARAFLDAPTPPPGPVPPPPPPRFVAPPPPVATPPPPPAPPVRTPTEVSDAGRALAEKRPAPAVDERRAEILEAFRGLKKGDHFQLLGIERSATEQQVKEAYFRLARRFHPDAPLDPSLEELRGQREAVFVRLGQAQETLRSPQARAQYERMLGPRPAVAAPAPPPPSAESPAIEPPTPAVVTDAPPPEPERPTAVDALATYRKAVSLFGSEKYWDAIQLLEPVMRHLDPTTRTKAGVMLGRLYMKNPKWLHQAEDTLREVLRRSPEHADAYAALGTLYASSGLRSRAVVALRRALEIDPGNQESQAALAALGESAAESVAPTSPLKKLFGRR